MGSALQWWLRAGAGQGVVVFNRSTGNPVSLCNILAQVLHGVLHRVQCRVDAAQWMPHADPFEMALVAQGLRTAQPQWRIARLQLCRGWPQAQ